MYNSPVNRFVASFVGTPPMNFMEGTLVEKEGATCFDGQEFRIRIPDNKAASVKSLLGKDAVLGVRPEAIGSVSEGRFAGQDNVIPATVQVIEPLGEKMDVYTTTAKYPHIVARVDSRSDLHADMEINLHLDMRKVHIFQPGDLGKNLTSNI